MLLSEVIPAPGKRPGRNETPQDDATSAPHHRGRPARSRAASVRKFLMLKAVTGQDKLDRQPPVDARIGTGQQIYTFKIQSSTPCSRQGVRHRRIRADTERITARRRPLRSWLSASVR